MRLFTVELLFLGLRMSCPTRGRFVFQTWAATLFFSDFFMHLWTKPQLIRWIERELHRRFRSKSNEQMRHMKEKQPCSTPDLSLNVSCGTVGKKGSVELLGVCISISSVMYGHVSSLIMQGLPASAVPGRLWSMELSGERSALTRGLNKTAECLMSVCGCLSWYWSFFAHRALRGSHRTLPCRDRALKFWKTECLAASRLQSVYMLFKLVRTWHPSP